VGRLQLAADWETDREPAAELATITLDSELTHDRRTTWFLPAASNDRPQ
jgi:hypothetical protein